MPMARAAAPKRIVTAGGAMTEIVCALGAGADLVAVDTTSLFPPALVATLPKIGYLRTLSAEGLLSTKPDLILADHDAGPPDVLERLRGMQAPVAYFSRPSSAKTVAEKIAFAGDAIDRAGPAEEMAKLYTADLGAVEGWVAALPRRPTVLFLMNAGTTGLRAAGAHTGAAEMIALAGAINAVGDAAGYKPVSAEAALAANPDYILLMQQSLDQLGGIAGVAALSTLAGLDAAKQGCILALDGAYLLGFGPRTAHAGRDLAALLHPDMRIPELPARAWTEA
jgi:iron complex transport system substrate-binding protein